MIYNQEHFASAIAAAMLDRFASWPSDSHLLAIYAAGHFSGEPLHWNRIEVCSRLDPRTARDLGGVGSGWVMFGLLRAAESGRHFVPALLASSVIPVNAPQPRARPMGRGVAIPCWVTVRVGRLVSARHDAAVDIPDRSCHPGGVEGE